LPFLGVVVGLGRLGDIFRCIAERDKLASARQRVGSSNDLFQPRIGPPLFAIVIRADIGASLAANLAGKARFQIGQPNLIRPAVAAGSRAMAALVVRAIDQEAANASVAQRAWFESEVAAWQRSVDECDPRRGQMTLTVENARRSGRPGTLKRLAFSSASNDALRDVCIQ
jgi:hypothetical protein